MDKQFENNGSDAIRSALERISSRPLNEIPSTLACANEWEQNWDQTAEGEWGETVP